jgi:hypothetical protein
MVNGILRLPLLLRAKFFDKNLKKFQIEIKIKTVKKRKIQDMNYLL